MLISSPRINWGFDLVIGRACPGGSISGKTVTSRAAHFCWMSSKTAPVYDSFAGALRPETIGSSDETRNAEYMVSSYALS
jgi:hypothetical protein